jgi:hypothetical protein
MRALLGGARKQDERTMTVTSYHGKPSQKSGLGELDPRDDGVPLEY